MSARQMHHEMLIANAGSGKTYRLTVRMITLLALGVAPEKIAALTFTKKAAAEFLDAVFCRVAAAAVDPKKLEALRADVGIDLDAQRCREMLVRLAAVMNRLSMGTIDSLFGRIARAFPFESGIAGDFSIPDDAALDRIRAQALAGVFRSWAAEDRQEFLKRMARLGRAGGERDWFTRLIGELASLHGKYLQTAAGCAWGQSQTVWPNGCEILKAGDPASATDAFEQAIDEHQSQLSDEARQAWKESLELVRQVHPGRSLPPVVRDFVKGKLIKFSVSRDGDEYVPMGRRADGRLHLIEPVRAARKALSNALLKIEFESLLVRSAALYNITARFDAAYGEMVGGGGMLTYSDITSLLAHRVDDPQWYAAVGYRMDATFDHWLLDEFQDTSRGQWKVLGAFIDEVVQDTDGTRSFFYVGDTKQAIYSWRGGDPRLFFEIRDKYNRDTGPECIRKAEPLAVSFRSDREIIEAVNKVFGNLGSVQEVLEIPAAAVEDWQQAWVPHSTAPVNAGRKGFVHWMGVTRNDDEESKADDAAILRVLQEVRPWERGLSCVALKRRNTAAADLAALLQFHGIPVALEGKANPCTDNPAGATLTAAFRVAGFPDDKTARALLGASGPGRALLEQKNFRTQALEQISEFGFAATAREWIETLGFSSDAFLESRAREFVKAAVEFDMARKPSEGIAEFLHHIENYQRQEPEGIGVVRVMTIHQAKGLTFDMALVSDLQEITKDRSAGSLALVGRGGIEMPSGHYSAEDPVLAKAREGMLAESAYGELCAAYVALTRPRHGLYIFTESLNADTSAKSFARLFMLTVGDGSCGFTVGDPNWHEAFALKTAQTVPEMLERKLLPEPTAGTPHPTNPSSLHGKPVLAPGTFPIPKRRPGWDAAEIGTEVHEFLAGIEWAAESFPSLGRLSRDAAELLRTFLKGEIATGLFKRPEHPCVVWREKAFDLLIEEKWVSGVFDRIHIRRGADGKPESATVYDFKTDRVSAQELLERHSEQLNAYRKVAARLLGLPETSVMANIVPVATDAPLLEVKSAE